MADEQPEQHPSDLPPVPPRPDLPPTTPPPPAVPPPPAAAPRYLADAQEYERRFLAGEPLGTDISITFTDGRRFTYDGQTGESTTE